jgi:hypothetical protein
VKARSLVIALALAMAVAPGAGLAKWTPITAGGGQSSTRNLGVARTADGVLHVVWPREAGAVLHTGISPSGRVGAATQIVTGWAGVGDAAAAVGASGELLAFWAGSRTTNTEDPLFGLNLATSTNGGTSWSVTPASIAKANFAHARTPSVVIVNGVPIQTWYAVGEPLVHVGLDPNNQGVLHAPPGTNQNIAAGSGEVWIAWCNGLTPTAGLGVWAERIDPASGAAASPAVRMPGSFTRFEGQDRHLCPPAARTALAARGGGGFFVAAVTGYPTETDLIVWRIGSPRSVLVARSRDGLAEEVALAADPSGRIWIGWSDAPPGGRPVVYVRRSNRAATVWGATVAVTAPASYVDFTNLDLAAQAARLDVVARFGSGSNVNVFHTQVLPGLTLAARGGKVVGFRVLDAGEPVTGATIRVGGRTLRTNAAGAASVNLPAGRFRAVASKAGYVSATARVRSA